MITDEKVRYVANLANLSLTEDELHRMAVDMAGILQLMDRLAEIDTTGVEPMAQVIFESAGETDGAASLRPDVERAPLGSEAAVASAPVASGGYFKVPRVIER